MFSRISVRAASIVSVISVMEARGSSVTSASIAKHRSSVALFRSYREIAKRGHYLRHVCLSVRPHYSAPTGHIFMKFDI